MAAPPSAEARTLLARLSEAASAGRHREAVDLARALTREEPELFEGWSHLAGAWRALGRTDRALEPMRHATALRPGSAVAAFNLGLLLADDGQSDEAVRQLTLARERVDDDPDPELGEAQRDEIRAASDERLAELRAGRIHGPDR